MVNADLNKTLEELENDIWGEPEYPSYVIKACHRIRRKRLRDLTTEELRLAIGQSMGLSYLLPIAIEVLSKNPMAQGDFYAGDLLLSVLRVPSSIWDQHPQLRAHAARISTSFFSATTRLDEEWKALNLPRFREAHDKFVQSLN